MITPQEIQDKEFGRGVRGYKEDEVDQFLDDITLDMEALIADNAKLSAEIEALNAKLDAYKNQEGSLIKTLETAKSLMNDIAASAEKRADILIRNAEIDAEAMLRQAKDKLASMQSEEKIITERLSAFKKRYKSMLEAELSQFEDFNKETDYINSVKNEQAKSEFNELLKAVENKSSEKKDFLEDEAFHTLQDEFSKTIIAMKDNAGK